MIVVMVIDMEDNGIDMGFNHNGDVNKMDGVDVNHDGDMHPPHFAKNYTLVVDESMMVMLRTLIPGLNFVEVLGLQSDELRHYNLLVTPKTGVDQDVDVVDTGCDG